MNTVLIYSYMGRPPTIEKLDIAHVSNYLAQKQGYTTILYVDKKNKKFFQSIPYSEVVEFDDKILEQLPRTVWSAGKILAASMETRPFLHIDFDLFILNNIFYDFIKDKEFVNYHFEPWLTTNRNINETLIQETFNSKAIKYFLKATKGIFGIKYSKNLGSYNFAIFGSCKQENIKIINKECEFVINALIKSKNILENMKFTQYISKNSFELAGVAVIVEQVITLTRIVNKLGSNYSILNVEEAQDTYTAGIKYGLLHLWGFKKLGLVTQILKNKREKYK